MYFKSDCTADQQSCTAVFSLLFPFYSGLPALLTVLYWMEEVPMLPKFLSGFEISVLKALSGVHSSLPCKPSLTEN